MTLKKDPASFRDNSAFVFYERDSVYRAIHSASEKSYRHFIESGLYQSLRNDDLVITHKEVAPEQFQTQFNDYPLFQVIEVEKIPFISYPYEWCFSQLKAAALLTLRIQLEALNHGMTLKDASAYNIQFRGSKPVFIDTLSFEIYEEGKPWVAYRQFCQHFLAPLALMSYVDPALNKMSQVFIDGMPLQLASGMLPWKTRFSAFYQLHLHYHAKLESKYAADTKAAARIRSGLSKKKLIAILHHLQSGISGLSLKLDKSEWNNYYNEFSYSQASIDHKKKLVLQWTGEVKPSMAWDLGSNTGTFSELIKDVCKNIVAFDIDHLSVEKLFLNNREQESGNILPLLLDLSNPSPAIGWANRERSSLYDRGPVNLVLALALVHHIAISNNVPFDKLAAFFKDLTEILIIEFVPKEDSQAQRLLVTRQDIFTGYTIENFESAFAAYFTFEQKEKISDSERTLYLMKRK